MWAFCFVFSRTPTRSAAEYPCAFMQIYNEESKLAFVLELLVIASDSSLLD
jgi:hypothetical protein